MKLLPAHRHYPVMQVLLASISACIALYLVSHYRLQLFEFEMYGFLVSDVFVLVVMIAVVWAIGVAMSVRQAVRMHVPQFFQKYRAGLEWIIWGGMATLAWFVVLLGLKMYIVLNLLRIE